MSAREKIMDLDFIYVANQSDMNELLTQAASIADASEQELLAENALLRKKVEVYESLLHRIQANAAVSMNVNNVHQLIKNICDWSYAHRVGNGELSDEEQNEYIQRAFDKLLEIKQ